MNLQQSMEAHVSFLPPLPRTFRVGDDRVCAPRNNQLTGKDFWHPDASRGGAEQLMQNGKHGCFIIRRSSNPG